MTRFLYIAMILSLAAGCAGSAEQQVNGNGEKAVEKDLRLVVAVNECASIPEINGNSNDVCWDALEWMPIDQVWIPWGASVPADDFQGQFKITWSSDTDMLYFLVEITDDVLVDGYRYPEDAYHNWDVVEIFIDEDASGGDHTLNQNAFAYHITAGNSDYEFEAMDLAAGWKKMNYSDHLQCVIEKQENNKYIWELALKVYDDSYKPGKKNNESVQLEAGKRFGLSIAYCDNDDPDESPKERDNFFGSVAVPKDNYNDHWQNADWFGQFELADPDLAENK